LRPDQTLELTDDERLALERIAKRSPRVDPASSRAKIVLAAAKGRSNEEIAAVMGLKPQTVSRWRKRYLVGRIQGIALVKKKRGRIPKDRNRHWNRILHVTKHEMPPNGRSWSCRSLAQHLKLSSSMVQRVWRQAGIGAETRRDLFAASPFRAHDHLRLLGCFFQAGHRAIVVEVLTESRSGITAQEPGPNPVISAFHLSIPTNPCTERLLRKQGQAASKMLERILVDQKIAFLKDVENSAGAGSQLRLITDGAKSFHQARVRRWLKQSERFTVHYSSASRDFLADAEANLRTFSDQKFARSLSNNLITLAAPEEKTTSLPTFEMGLGGSLSGVGVPSVFAAPMR
jgi:hypothetical protein